MRHLPNILSSLRLILAVLMPLADSQWWLLIIISSGASDGLDGWIARRYHCSSWQGALLDALADKLFMLSALLTLALHGLFTLYWLPLLLGRDILVACTALYGALSRRWQQFQQVRPRLPGKATTGSQFALLVAALVIPGQLFWVLPLTGLVSLVAAIDYGTLVYRHLAEK